MGKGAKEEPEEQEEQEVKAETTDEPATGHGGAPWELAIEDGFESLGLIIARFPWVFIGISFVVAVIFGFGMAVLESESRPDKQWVPTGAQSLDDQEYVTAKWPSQARFNLLGATCADAAPDDCNILQAKYMKELYARHLDIMDIVIDGDQIVAEWDEEYPDDSDRAWQKYAGMWTFEGEGLGHHVDACSEGCQHKCFKFGPLCAEQSVLDVFAAAGDTVTMPPTWINAEDVEAWGIGCTVDMRGSGGACYNAGGRFHANCSMTHDECDNADGAPASMYAPTASFADVVANITDELVIADVNDWDDGSDARVDVKTMVGGLKVVDGQIVEGKALMGFYTITKDDVFVQKSGSLAEPLADEWERQALCALGIDHNLKSDGVEDGIMVKVPGHQFPADKQSCKDSKDAGPGCVKRMCYPSEILDFSPQFSRSLGDEFGAAIKGDVAAIVIAYYIMTIYLSIMLSRFDTVHSMMGMSAVAIIACLMSYVSGMGIGGYIGIFNNNLTGNIPFLLLGLGIDDAFVLSSEFFRACRMNPTGTVEENISKGLRGGGMSIFITSLTDCLAFLIGSTTVLPALHWFCIFAGFGIFFCFFFQIFFFVPCLVINARRAESGRLDFLCCLKSKNEMDPRQRLEEPQGCCCCGCPTGPPGRLSRFLGEVWSPFITSTVGMAVTAVVFLVISVMGFFGLYNIEQDFKLEWFVPSDSYVQSFFTLNEEYFKSGTSFDVYTKDIDYYQSQSKLVALDNYLTSTEYVDQTDGVKSWHREFLEYAGTQPMLNHFLDPDTGVFTNEDAYYTQLYQWTSSFAGAQYASSIKWKDSRCIDDLVDTGAECDPQLGLASSRIQAKVSMKHQDTGKLRYDAMTAMRNEIANIESTSFPFSFQFLYWEEVGVIGAELVKNLLICGAVIATIVALLIPRPRVFLPVIFCIVLSVLDTVGFMYYWDVTISSISTIYILICVGLAVDYAAHIAHFFKDATGTSTERVAVALSRIGPSVFNAIISTFLAILILSTSTSYVFVVFFKALFLVVTIAGAHGLWLMPVMLALLGGDNGEREDDSPPPFPSLNDSEKTDNPAADDAEVGKA